ncbi:hypothetical protein ETB97_009269 [Aspergillus alliaceus]|uniref:Uncharacterized protein n=1 Tax=Petromyces alliaceus TaxID=209559 RepID=A0A8H6E8Z0_PETAA|nr:hypothetical protein ETB97_009269 [Aspergillus burnettii]
MEPRQRQNRVVKEGFHDPMKAEVARLVTIKDREHGVLNTSAKGLVVPADDQLVGGDQIPGKDIKEMAEVVNDAFAEHVSTALVHSQSNPDVVALD